MREAPASRDERGIGAAQRFGAAGFGSFFMAFTAPVVIATAASESTYQCETSSERAPA